MRRILVDHARKRSAARRGSGAERVTFDELAIEAEDPDLDLLALDRALEALAEHDARLADVVHLRYFAGLGIEETSEVIGTSPATVKRDWTYARAWLLERMSRPPTAPSVSSCAPGGIGREPIEARLAHEEP